MATNRKIEPNVPDLLVKYHEAVSDAANKGVYEALVKHRQNGNPVAVSREGKVVVVDAQEILDELSPCDRIWNNEQDDIYSELLKP